MKTKKLCAILGLGVVVLMTLSLLSVAGAGAQAQEGGPPVLPCAFYGNVTIAGNPAPVGTEIIAKIEDRTCGNITVLEAGKYGEAAGVKLLVNGAAEDANKIISFYVDGAKAAENAAWNSAEIKHLDISVKEAGPGVTPTATGPTAGPGAGEGAMPVAVVIGIVVAVVVAAALILVGLRMRKS